MPADRPNELFDVVDEADQVIGQATRQEVHERGLLHRAAHVFVTNSRGELLVQQRSSTKDSYPLHWTSSASGHLDAGESYLEAAGRELREEIGLEATLEFLVKLPAGPETSNEHTVLFGAISDENPIPDPSEVAAVASYSLDDLCSMLSDDPGRFDPPFRTLLRWYLDRPIG